MRAGETVQNPFLMTCLEQTKPYLIIFSLTGYTFGSVAIVMIIINAKMIAMQEICVPITDRQGATKI